MSRPREPLPFRRPGIPEPPPGPPKQPARRRASSPGVGLYVALAGLVAIALMLAPSLQQSPDGPLSDRARSDCITIGSAILRFHADTGLAPRWFRSADALSSGATRVMVIVGPGRIPRELGATGWTTEATDELHTQLATNGPGYPLMGPDGSRGWNGPYLAPGQIGPDPWNNRYLANAGLLSSRNGEPGASGRQAVWVLSAGPNGIVETAFLQSADRAQTGGDDIAYRIQ